MTTSSAPDLICLSRERWSAPVAYRRAHHLMARFAVERRVFFVEEPRFEEVLFEPTLATQICPRSGVHVAIPRLPLWLARRDPTAVVHALVDELLALHALERYVVWLDAPGALPLAAQLAPIAIVYDRAGASTAAGDGALEAQLVARADLVLTVPSGIDVRHFARARTVMEEPPDQADLPLPRVGLFGGVDEHVDTALLGAIAAARPDWSVVIVGPVARPVPRAPNLHLLGPSSHDTLPAYLAGWDVALLPFFAAGGTVAAQRALEAMAAGCAVVSTPLPEVTRPFGDRGLVRIAADADAFARACEEALDEDAVARTRAHDALLAERSWERVYATARDLVDRAVAARQILAFPSSPPP